MDPYASEYNPPAPIVDIIVSNPYNPTVSPVEDRGLIDSGAFKTVIPEEWVDRLGLLPVRTCSPQGYKIEEKKQEHKVYIARVTLKQYSFDVEVIAARREYGLIGRDILNQLRLILDGKSLSFDITDP